MKTIFSILLLTFSAGLSAQVTTETRNVSDFKGIRVLSTIQLELTQSDQNSVIIESILSQLPQVITEVKDGILVISYDGKKIMEDVVAKVSVKSISSIEMEGAAEVKTMNLLNADTFEFYGSGATEGNVDVNANFIRIQLQGASSLKVTGTTETLVVTTSGASDLKADELTSVNTTVASSGASSAKVHASGKIDASASGASEIHIAGNPANKTVNATGAGEIVMQEVNHSKNDTVSFPLGDRDVAITPRQRHKDRKNAKNYHKKFKYWQGFDFGFCGYLNPSNKLDMAPGFEWMELNYAKSQVSGINIFQKNIHIYQNKLNLGVGLGMTYYNYSFRNAISLQPNVPFATAIYDSLNYRENKLNACYINIPLFLEFNTNHEDPSNSFHFAAGTQVGYNIFSNRYFQKFEEDMQTCKRQVRRTVKDDFNINPFRIDLIVRVGYNRFTIFGTYSLSSLFERGKGPAVYPFALGIHFF